MSNQQLIICLWLPLSQFKASLLEGQVVIWSEINTGKGNRVIKAPSVINKLSPGILFNKNSRESQQMMFVPNEAMESQSFVAFLALWLQVLSKQGLQNQAVLFSMDCQIYVFIEGQGLLSPVRLGLNPHISDLLETVLVFCSFHSP